jgi:long-subunit acyl-CoA synthetase (AMP-forming)
MSMDLGRLYDCLAEQPARGLQFVTRRGSLEAVTFMQLRERVDVLVSRLSEYGLRPGDLVGILGPNSPEWIAADLALQRMGCISVALPVEGRRTEVDTEALVERYDLSALLLGESIAVKDGLSPAAGLLTCPAHLTRREPEGGQELTEDTFTVAFSSGTAGTRKGLALSRRGVENTIEVSSRAWGVTEEDKILVALPFSSFQQRYLMYLAIQAGAEAAVVPPERLFQKLEEIEPTIVLGPPSFFELLDNRVSSAPPSEKIPYYLARALDAAAPAWSRPVRVRLGRRWTGVYGSRIRLMLVGSAPVPRRLLDVHRHLGLPLYEVYGATEVGWVAFNLPPRHRAGTSGVPVDGIELEIDEDGAIRIRIRAPQATGYVFEGVETTDAVFLADGSIATGDVGRIEDSGFLQLLGRNANVIITRSGVKISPEEIEREIEGLEQVERALVFADGQGTALCCVAWLGGSRPEADAESVREQVARWNREREPARRIVDLVFKQADELTVESGLLTRNLKLNRAEAERRVLSTSEPAGR